MNRTLLFVVVLVTALIGAVAGSILTLRLYEAGGNYQSIEERQNLRLANYLRDSSRRLAAVDFTESARLVTPAVVHIRAVYGPGDFSLNPLDSYFNPPARSSGSGVIISDDGFIVTNNHVIEDATNLEVILSNNQRFFAKVIGRDPTTDLALIKIKCRNLPFVKYGNSDTITPGEWVLAIGNPFDLNSTVTAGIVSAMARNIDILRDRNQLQVESFIQTDAAVNPGNSGGALVNLKGELIGINSAIATSTGGYAGYSFAIPVTLVKKIVDDLMEFGQVQRGILGVQIDNVSAELAEVHGLDVVRGVLVNRVNPGSAAESGGMERGDVITSVNNRVVNNVSELQEWIARNRPGQSVTVTYRRAGNEKTVSVVLKNFEGSEELTRQEVSYELGGASFEDLPYRDLARLNLDGGVRVIRVGDGKWKRAGIKDSFVITHLDKVPVDNVEDLNRILRMKHGGMLVEGVTADGDRGTFGVNW